MNTLPTSDGWNTLNETCWFDYDGLSGEQRCTRFIRAYEYKFRKVYARKIDARNASKVEAMPGLRGYDLRTLSSEARRALAKAVAVADVLGIPYEFACSQIFNLFSRDERRPELPTVDDFSDPQLRGYLARQWEKKKRFADWLPHPKTLARCPSRVRAYLQELVACSGRPGKLVANLLEKGYVTEEEAMELFGPEGGQQGIGRWNRRRTHQRRNPRETVTTTYAVAVAQSAMEGAWTRSMSS